MYLRLSFKNNIKNAIKNQNSNFTLRKLSIPIPFLKNIHPIPIPLRSCHTILELWVFSTHSFKHPPTGKPIRCNQANIAEVVIPKAKVCGKQPNGEARLSGRMRESSKVQSDSYARHKNTAIKTQPNRLTILVVGNHVFLVVWLLFLFVGKAMDSFCAHIFLTRMYDKKHDLAI